MVSRFFKNLLGSNNAITFIFARALSSTGSALTAFGLDVWILERTGSYSTYAVLATISILPGMIFAPIAGLLVDRYSRKKILLSCDAIAAATIFFVLLINKLNLLSPLVVGTVGVVLGLVNTLSWPAAVASVTDLSTPEERIKVNGLSETLNGSTIILGPVLGALLLSYLGISGIAAVDLGSYFLCSLLVLRIKFPTIANLETSISGRFRPNLAIFIADLTYGFRWIFARRDLRKLLLFFALTNFASSIFFVALAPYLLTFSTKNVLALCSSMSGAGIIVGGGLYAAMNGFKRHEFGILLGTIAMAILMIAFGLLRSPISLYICIFLYGICIPQINASSQNIWQSAVPREIQGRVFVIRKMIAWGLNPFAIMVSIPLTKTLFSPLLMFGSGTWRIGSLWGFDQSGTLGLMLSTCGVLCFTYALLLFSTDGLKIEYKSTTRLIN